MDARRAAHRVWRLGRRGPGLWKAPVTGGDRVRVQTPAFASEPVIAPNRDVIAYISARSALGLQSGLNVGIVESNGTVVYPNLPERSGTRRSPTASSAGHPRAATRRDPSTGEWAGLSVDRGSRSGAAVYQAPRLPAWSSRAGHRLDARWPLVDCRKARLDERYRRARSGPVAARLSHQRPCTDSCLTKLFVRRATLASHCSCSADPSRNRSSRYGGSPEQSILDAAPVRPSAVIVGDAILPSKRPRAQKLSRMLHQPRIGRRRRGCQPQ